MRKLTFSFWISGRIQRCICKFRTYCLRSCHTGFLLCLFSKVETFGLILANDCVEYKIRNKQVKPSSLSKAVTYHVRNFSESMPYRLSKKIHFIELKIIQIKFNSTKRILTLRSVLLHCSDNFQYLFGLHLRIFLSIFGRASF